METNDTSIENLKGNILFAASLGSKERIASLVKSKIKEKFQSQITPDFDSLEQKSGNIFISDGFARGSGLSDIKICVEGNQIIGLQLQGNELRYVTEVIGKEAWKEEFREKNMEFAFKLIEAKHWFCNRADGSILLGKGRTSCLKIDDKTTFNSFKPNFIYLYRDVSDFCTKSIDELTTLISDEANWVLENIDKIKSCLQSK